MASRSSRLSLRRRPSMEKDEDNSRLTVQFISDDDVGKIITKMELPSGQAKENEAATEIATPKSNRKSRKRNITNTEVETIIEEETNHEEELQCGTKDQCEKPKGLCDDDEIGGDMICSFRTPSKRQGMILKARESASKFKDSGTKGTPKAAKRTPSKPITPLRTLTPDRKLTPGSSQRLLRQMPKRNAATPSRREGETNVAVSKTPYHLRAKQKKAIKVYRRQLENIDTESDEDSDSDYEGSGSESSATEPPSDQEDSDSDSGKGSVGPKTSCRRSLRFQPPSATPPSKTRGKDLNYVFTADEYFESKISKCKTSDNVLSRLKTPRLEPGDMLRLLGDSSGAPAHCSILAQRRANDLVMYERWMIALSQGFSILAYGLGSKYKILQNFHRRMLSDSHVLVVNGFFPSINIKEIVEMVARDLLGLKQTLPSLHAVVDWIENRRWMPRVFLIIHNMDAEPLRCDKTQQLLARLASLPKVHLVASIDHINCPLLWDQSKLSAFNFMWEDTTSFLPYQEETSYETSLMVHNSGSLAISSLLNVYRSLTHNSRGVFRIILHKHLDENNPKYTGMAFSELYGRCREEMLVTSDLALRTMLTEFLDHQMVKWRRDGEHLYIPTDVSVLQQFNSLVQND